MSERYFRESNVAISNRTRWMLTRIAKASVPENDMHVPATVDSVAESILSTWIERNHPQLQALWKQREQIDTDAEAKVNERKV